MFKLAYSTYEVVFELEENKVNTWIVENPATMVDLICELSKQCEGQEGNFILSEENKILNISKSISFVKEPFSIDCNNRKILTRLFQELEKENALEWNEVQQNFYSSYIEYITWLCQKSDFFLTFLDKPNLQDILKIAEVKVNIQAQTLLEKIIEYVKLCDQLLKQHIFVFLNLKVFLTRQEIEELYKECFYRKIHLILIEASHINRFEVEKTCIIDKDNCVIYY